MSDHLNKRVANLEEKVSRLEQLNAPRKQNTAGVGPQQASAQKDDSASGEPLPKAYTPPAPSDKEKSNKPWHKTLDGWNVPVQLEMERAFSQ
jgi:hypothetical protein